MIRILNLVDDNITHHVVNNDGAIVKYSDYALIQFLARPHNDQYYTRLVNFAYDLTSKDEYISFDALTIGGLDINLIEAFETLWKIDEGE